MGGKKQRARSLQLPGRSTSQSDTRVQFHQDQTHFLAVHEAQIAIYETTKLECLKQARGRKNKLCYSLLLLDFPSSHHSVVRYKNKCTNAWKKVHHLKYPMRLVNPPKLLRLRQKKDYMRFPTQPAAALSIHPYVFRTIY